MRKKEREITDIREIEQVIAGADICRIGFVDGDEPYIVPVSFGYEENAIYFHSALEGRKINLIRRNGKVCFELDTDVVIVKSDNACDWGTKYRSVIGTGYVKLLESDDEKINGLKVIMKHYSPDEFRFPPSKLATVLVLRIDIDRIIGKKAGY
ncbi:MAG: pyridoxamine 5'-phosphate oxidase family protein [Dehalococcoidales bacterium]